MSYYRFNSEIIKVKNENLNTRSFLESVQRYIMDLMNGVRIESLGKLFIDVYLDDLHILINKEKSGSKENKTEIRGNCRTKEVAEYALQNMREYENITLNMEYDAMAFYFYPFGIERISALLSDKLSEYVVYKCKELTDETANLYVFEKRNGKLYHGMVAPGDIEEVKGGTVFNLERFYFWYEFDKIISREKYNRIKEITTILTTRQDINSYFDCVYEVDEGIEISDLVITRYNRHANNEFEERKLVYSLEDIKEIFQVLHQVHDEIKDYVDVVNPEITFSSPVNDEAYYVVMITAEDERYIDLGVYSTQSDNVVQYKNGRGITIEMMEDVGEVYLPMGNIDFLEE